MNWMCVVKWTTTAGMNLNLDDSTRLLSRDFVDYINISDTFWISVRWQIGFWRYWLDTTRTLILWIGIFCQFYHCRHVFIVKYDGCSTPVWQAVKNDAVYRSVMIFAVDSWVTPWSPIIHTYDSSFDDYSVESSIRIVSDMREIVISNEGSRWKLRASWDSGLSCWRESRTWAECWRRIHQNWSWFTWTDTQWKIRAQ